MCSDRRKNHDCGHKKTEGTSSARSGVRTAAKCGELKRCADRVGSRMDNKDEVVEGKFSNLNFLPSTKKTTEYSFELLLSIYRYLIFFSQVLNFTSVELNRFAKQAKLLKNPLFQRRRWSCDFPARETPVGQKHCAVSRQGKMPFATPSPSGCLGSPLPLPHRLYGWADGCTLTSQLQFLGLIGYQICLFAVVLRWRAGSATLSLGAEFLTWTFNVLIYNYIYMEANSLNFVTFYMICLRKFELNLVLLS